MRKLAINKTLLVLALVASSFNISAETQNQNDTIALETSKSWSYAVPDNTSYGALRKIIEVQGHQQLNLGRWSSGKNDLTATQIRKLNFRKLEFSGFSDGLNVEERLSEIPMRERISQVSDEKAGWDNLVRSSAKSGAIIPISDVALSHDDINALLFSAWQVWDKEPTNINRGKYIQALGLLAARRSDILNAHARNIYIGVNEASNEFTEYSKVTKCYYKGKMSVIINEAYFLQGNTGPPNCNGLSNKQMSSLDWSKLNLDPIFPITTTSWKHAQ